MKHFIFLIKRKIKNKTFNIIKQFGKKAYKLLQLPQKIYDKKKRFKNPKWRGIMNYIKKQMCWNKILVKITHIAMDVLGLKI